MFFSLKTQRNEEMTREYRALIEEELIVLAHLHPDYLPDVEQFLRDFIQDAHPDRTYWERRLNKIYTRAHGG